MPAGAPTLREADWRSLPDALAPYAAKHEEAGVFFNPWGVESGRRVSDLLRWKAGSNPFAAQKRLSAPPELVSDPAGRWAALPRGARAQWLGHASVLVEIDGLHVLIDPVFGRAGPAPRLRPPPLLPEALPPADVVLLTHGHYDHFDRASLAALAERSPGALFAVPRGQQRSLPGEVKRSVSLDWWQIFDLQGVEFCLVPAQHWHQRGPFDRNRALWGGWVIRGSASLYHSGDTGYFEGFKAIGAVFPGLDLAVLPLGAYEPRWFMSPQHMSPEGSVAAVADLGAAHMLGMHWGTFDLTDEPLNHGPGELLPALIQEQGLDPARFHVLAPGGVMAFGAELALSGAI